MYIFTFNLSLDPSLFVWPLCDGFKIISCFQFTNSSLFFLFYDPMAFQRLISSKRCSLMNISSKLLNAGFALKSIITNKFTR
jgi:hypothetical protein